jgi:predicted lipoprotein with Yx(FWY)xxD motif
MKRLSVLTVLVWCLVALAAAAQSITPPFPVTLEKELAARASNYTEVSLDKKMLAFAGKFLSADADDVEAKQLLATLNGIYVREYKFDKPGQYTTADLEHIRSQFNGSEWSPMVRERSKKGEGDSDIYVRLVDGKMQGMFVLDAGPNDLSFVYIDGALNPAELSKLDGSFGIPKGVAKRAAKEGTK